MTETPITDDTPVYDDRAHERGRDRRAQWTQRLGPFQARRLVDFVLGSAPADVLTRAELWAQQPERND